MSPETLALLALAGAACGWVNVLAGGGSMFTIPVLLFIGLPGPVANGTNRIAIIAQNIAAVAEFWRKGFSDFRLSATLSLAASIGAVAGARIGVELDGVWFNRTVALVMLGVMALMATDRGAPVTPSANGAPAADHATGRPRNLALGHALMVGAGLWGGFIQIGVGFLLMPILNRVMGLDLVRTNMHKAAIALAFSLAALAVFAAKVEIAWAAGAALALGNAFGGWLGARTSIRRGDRFIRRAMFAMIVILAAKLLFFP